MHNAVLFSKMDESIVESKKGVHIMTFSPQPYHLTLTSVIQKCINLNFGWIFVGADKHAI